MICPRCGHPDSKVLDTRTSGSGIRRRRQCLACGFRFTTHERVERKLPLVVKKDGRRVAYERDKVLDGLRVACRKRPVSAEALEQATDRVEQRLLGLAAGEVSSAEIGRAVLDELRQLDLVGFLRFASVYFEVGSPSEFMALVQPLLDGTVPPERPAGRGRRQAARALREAGRPGDEA